MNTPRREDSDLMDDGMTRAEAERSARLEFGNVALIEERSRENMADSSDDRGQPDNFREFQKIERAGKLTVRIYEAFPVRDFKTLADAGIVAPFGSPYLRIGNLKAFADGALASETAWMDEPFTNNPTKSGLASPDLLDVEHFYESMRQADKAGLQLTIHAIGDRANRTILDLYGRLEK